MNMRHLMIFLVSASLSFGISQYAHNAYGKEATKKVEVPELVCDTPEKIESFIAEKGYIHFADMESEKGLKEKIWISGEGMVITGDVEISKTCFLAQFTKLVFDSDTLQLLYKTWDQQETRKKGI